MDKHAAEIIETLSFLKEYVEKLPTREDVREIIHEELTGSARDTIRQVIREETADMREDIRYIRQEVIVLRRDVEELKERVRSHDGFAKDIDHALERIRRIEQHIGITPHAKLA
jgi:hypothetical protein